jgi:flavin-dependent dehydrogenase
MTDSAGLDFDVVVLGGGPAGCATALTLNNENVGRVLVAEASGYEQPRIGESVPPDIRQLLQQLGLLDRFLAEGHDPCLGSCSSWGSDELGYNDFIFNPFGNGWHLDRRRFDEFLAREVQQRGVELRGRTKFLDVLSHGGDGVRLRLSGPDGDCEVTAKFVVDATGKRSLFARRCGARRRDLDRLISVSAFFDLPEQSPFARLTFLEAVEYGWWYTARLPGQRIAVAVATSHELYQHHRFDEQLVWLTSLAQTRHIAPALAECRFVPGSLVVCDAPSFVLDHLHGDHWLAVGDAASSYDPISSQGIYKALADGLGGGRAIAAHLGGNPQALAEHQAHVERRFGEYERMRAYFYNLERRWETAPFWQSRQRPIPVGGSAAD